MLLKLESFKTSQSWITIIFHKEIVWYMDHSCPVFIVTLLWANMNLRQKIRFLKPAIWKHFWDDIFVIYIYHPETLPEYFNYRNDLDFNKKIYLILFDFNKNLRCK